MRRFLILILAVSLLCGCTAGPEPTAESAPLMTETSRETMPAGLLEAGSTLEKVSQGAAQIYLLPNEEFYGAVPMGDEMLLFSGTERTSLTILSGPSRYIRRTATLDCAIYPEDGAVKASEKGVTYYDEFRRELVFLDSGLKEVSRISLPEEMQGAPALSADRKHLYYCTADALRVLELETGLHKLLREMDFTDQSVTRLHCCDTIIECIVYGETGGMTLFISAQTGEILQSYAQDILLQTDSGRYFAFCVENVYPEMLVGSDSEPPRLLYNMEPDAMAYPVLNLGGVILARNEPETESVILDYYDLDSGKRSAMLELPGQDLPWSIYGDPNGNCVWMLWHSEEYGQVILCRWQPELSPTADEAIYITSRFSFESPDQEGLKACKEQADVLSEQYGVDIRIWEDAASVQPWDYTITPEYHVPALRQGLAVLDRALSCYPEGFLKKAATVTSSGKLRICLVQSIRGIDGSGSLDQVQGLMFWDDREDAYLALTLGNTTEQTIYHELCHFIDSRVMSISSAYDDWESLNPEGFEYDYDYQKNLERQPSQLTQGETRAFIDTYSMSFPKEDRARIMEYAMMADCGDLFRSPIMQQKLQALSTGIREAFKLKKFPETFLWEQHLSPQA